MRCPVLSLSCLAVASLYPATPEAPVAPATPGVVPAADVLPVSPAGLALAKRLDASGVDKRWQPGRLVDWKTGEVRGAPPTDGKPHTHCSAFAASFAEDCGAWLPKPPEYRPVLLATKQAVWLEKSGAGKGWTRLPGALEAQRRANAGELVVAVYPSPDPEKSGHIALIRPAAVSPASVAANGPRITQAGLRNGLDMSLRDGFSAFRHASRRDAIVFYAHAVTTPAP